MAYTFNGSSAYLEEVSSDFASLPLTAACRFYGNNVYGAEVAFCNNTDQASFMLRRTGSSTPRVSQTNAAGTAQSATSVTATATPSVTVGRWTSNSLRDLFSNNVAKETNAVTSTGTLTPPTRMRIGAGSGASGAVSVYTAAVISQVAVWNVALTDEECTALALGKAPFHLIRPENQIRLYDLLDLNDKRGQRSLTAYGGAAYSSTLSRPRYPHRANRVVQPK